MRRTFKTVLALALACVVACGGDSNDDDGGGGGGGGGGDTSGNITARVDGADWESTVTSADAGVGPLGSITIQGTYANTRTITIILSNNDEPGTYPLGVTAANVGGLAVYSTTSGESWSTPPSGAAGSITLTTLAAGRIAGTFSFTATPQGGGATGNKVVTDGAFDLLLAGTLATLPDNQGSSTTGSVNGSPWTAATSFMTLTGGSLVLNVSNASHIIGVVMTGFPGPGTYDVGLLAGKAATSAVVPASGASPSWVADPSGSGTFTVSSLTATRIRGTLTATLQPSPGSGATGTLTIANLAFDIGRQ